MPTTAKLFFGSTQLGGSPNAAVFDEASSTNATFSDVTWDSVDYRQAVFTANGTLAFASEGLVQALIVGGGGSGGTYYGSGGGGGQVLQLSNYYVPAGNVSVVVGAGGSDANTSPVTRSGKPSTFNGVMAVGGGHGGHSGYGGSGANGGGGSHTQAGGASIAGGYTGFSSPGDYQASGGGGAGGNGTTSSGGAGLQVWGTYYSAGGGENSSSNGTGWSSSGYGHGGFGSYVQPAGTSDGRQGIVIVRVAV